MSHTEAERVAGADYEHSQALGQRVSQDRKQALMALLLECAHQFHERELGKPYIEFKGRQT